MTPDEYCQQKAAASGSSFYYSFLFLPPPRRRAITALYAFCREVDDVVDEVHDAGVAEAKLAWWRQEIARTFHATPAHPVAQALVPVVREPLISVKVRPDGNGKFSEVFTAKDPNEGMGNMGSVNLNKFKGQCVFDIRAVGMDATYEKAGVNICNTKKFRLMKSDAKSE